MPCGSVEPTFLVSCAVDRDARPGAIGYGVCPVTRLTIREEYKATQDEVQLRGRGLGWMSLGLGPAPSSGSRLWTC